MMQHQFSHSTPASQGVERREGRKNYVFVDEHNRHKRLKVMRACNGCRRRKIKCDSATTNIWPCTACTRLKLTCIPPSVEQDGEDTVQAQVLDAGRPSIGIESNTPTAAAQVPRNPTKGSAPSQASYPSNPGSLLETTRGYDDPRLYNPQPYLEPSNDGRHVYQHNSFNNSGTLQPPFNYDNTPRHPPPPPQLPTPTTFSTSSKASDMTVLESPELPPDHQLTDAFGELKIDITGVAPYLRQQKKSEKGPEPSIPDECAAKLPPLQKASDLTSRLPSELMPSDSESMNYFRTYFKHIHPYVPVVHRSDFYQQWQRDKWSISPLLLVAIFACAAKTSSEDPEKVSQWLAVANKYETDFMEAPRLSTVQALLLLLKAREAMPRKGYYYRSWQTVKTIVSMSKDLDIHEHYDFHAEGKPCGFDSVECLLRTRVWQTALATEIMIGGPQGRSDFGVDPDTVETRPTWNISELDSYETERSRQFAYFVQNTLNIRRITDSYHKIKKQKIWGSDPRFVKNNPLFDDWMANLPQDLQVTYPPDASPPWLPSHFVGNMHSHFHLAIIMLHRPQLVAADSFAAGGEWRTHMSLCYSSAKALCRLQDSILSTFGLSGLLYMQRGINFTIYGILTCVMLHLIAITSPDPEFHTDARMYFTRHMRILEQCISSWPMAELQSQLDALRLAFSADIHKPFELKPTFPYGSPPAEYRPIPSNDPEYQRESKEPDGAHLSFNNNYPVSPPTSANTSCKPESSPSTENFAMPVSYSQHLPPQQVNVPLVDENNWNPTRIINQWDLAFSHGVNPSSPPSTTTTSNITTGAQAGYSLPQPQNVPQYTAQYPYPSIMTAVGSHQQQQQRQQQGQEAFANYPYTTLPVVITARDWQKSVASVYDPDGAKRRWEPSEFADEKYSKRRRA